MKSWTKDQNDAITKSGTNLIVSAGAGSGKTAVLIERVLKKLESGIHINELLILTFTKKASEEMKERIRTNLKKVPELQEELALLDISYITTFDSFCLSIVKKYHYLLNLPRSPEITDETMLEILKRNVLRKVLDSFYEKNDDSFYKLLEEFCVKDDDNIYDCLLTIVGKLENNFTKKEQLINDASVFLHEFDIPILLEEYRNLLLEYQKNLKEKLLELERIAPKEYIEKCYSNLSGILHSTTIDELVSYKSSKMPPLPRNLEEEVKQKKEEVNESFKSFLELLEYGREDKLKKDLQKMNPFIKTICFILKEYFIELESQKKEQEYFDFNDIAFYALKLLKEFPNVLEEMKNSFQEIMIDEYQDTNDTQESLISLISNQNVYMVGDIKQSIYRFRNANPYLFKEKYDSYKEHQNGEKIDLVKNFRSRSEVLKNINLIFNLLMSDSFGGANYIQEHQMSYGNLAYQTTGKTKENYNMEIYTYQEKKELGYTKEEIEIFTIGNDIKKKIKEGFLLFDKDKNEVHPANYNDFVILIDRSSSFSLYKKIFNYLNIPINIQKEETLNDSSCFYVIKNILYLINAYHKKRVTSEFSFFFTSVARSFLFELRDEEIYNIVSTKNWYQNKIYEQLENILKTLSIKTLREILIEIYKELNIYEKLIHIGNIKENMAILNHILELAYQYGEKNHNLEEFYEFLNQVGKEDMPIRFEMNEQVENSVTLMTIHKSKGLEFPVCYFAGLYKTFNIQELKNRFQYDERYGFFTPIKEEGIYFPFLKELIKYNFTKEEISEKIRLFYVAVTRAKEKMIFVLPKKEQESNEFYSSNLLSSKTFADFLYLIWHYLKDYQKEIELEKINLTKEYMYEVKKEEKEITNTEKIIVEEINIPKEEITSKRYSKEQLTLYTKEEKENIELGLKMHEYLECIDFRNPKLELISNAFLRKKVKHFIESALIQENINGKFYKEYEFQYEEEKQEYHGIIDLIIEQEDEIIIIDYKLNNLVDEAYKKQLTGYQDFIKKKTNKKIKLYLYSILNESFSSIEIFNS